MDDSEVVNSLHPIIQKYHSLVYHLKEDSPEGVLFAYGVVSSCLSYVLQEVVSGHPLEAQMVAQMEMALYEFIGVDKDVIN